MLILLAFIPIIHLPSENGGKGGKNLEKIGIFGLG